MGSVLSVVSVAKPGWEGRVEIDPSITCPEIPEESFFGVIRHDHV